MTEIRPPRGVKTKLFGAGLLFLGILDSLLSWRAGIAVNSFYPFLIASGIALIVIGALRQRLNE